MSSSKKYVSIRRSPLRYTPIMVLIIFSINVLGLVLPLTMKRIYNSIIVSRASDTLVYLLTLVLIALFFESIMRYLRDTSSKWVASKYEYSLTTHMVEALFKKDVTHSNYLTMLETLKSTNKVSQYYSKVYYQLLIDVPFMAIFLYLIYLFGGMLVLVPISLSVLYCILIVVFSSNYFKRKNAFMEENEHLTSMLIETLDNIHLIKAVGLEESQIIKYNKAIESSVVSEYKSQMSNMLMSSFGSRFSQLSLFMTLIVGGYLISNGNLSFGSLTACAMLSGRSMSPAIDLMNYYKQKKDIHLLKNRIEATLDQKDLYDPNTAPFPPDLSGMIEMMDLAYLDLQTSQMKTLNAKINVGDCVAIAPEAFPSYVSILRQIAGYERVKSGKLLIDNRDVDKWNMSHLSGKIDYLTEVVPLFKGSVLSNITFYNDVFNERAFHAAALTGLDDLVSQMPEGFESELDHYMLNYLSAAFLQRLNLTRAFVVRPRILILDRIDESMDQETKDIFTWLLMKLKGQVTILLVSRNEEIRGLADYELQPETVNQKDLEVSYE